MSLVNQPQTQNKTKVSDPDENLEPEILQVEFDREEHLNPGYSEILLVSSPSSQKQPPASPKTKTNTKEALNQHPRISSLLSSSPSHRNIKTTSPKKISFAPSSDQTVVIANTSPNTSMPSYKNAGLAKKRVNFPDSIPNQTESPLSSMSADPEDNHHNPPSSLRTVRVFNHHHDGNPHPYAPQDRMEPRIISPSTQERALPKTSFPSSGLGKSGQIEARHCTRTILFRNWSTQYWIHEYPVTIHLFDTMEDREVWSRSYLKRHPPASASASSPTSIMEFKDQDDDSQDLIQFSINFDTQGHLQKRIDKVERKRNKILGLEGNKKKISDEGKEYKDFQSNLVKKYVMEDVRSKYYSKSGPLIHACKVSYLGNGGRIIACAFGSADPSELKQLRAVLRYCLQLTKKAKAKSNKKHNGGTTRRSQHAGPQMDREEDTMTNLYEGDSLISGVKSNGYSVISGVSKTEYGKQTMDKKALKRMKQGQIRS